jgi:uncharacterized protein YhfF
MNEAQTEAYWQTFLESLPAASPWREAAYVAEAWGDSPQLAQELADLIVAGTKTATCSALWEWQAEGGALPQVGQVTIVLDGASQPVGIVETVEISVRPYNEVDAQFAYEEGEGDRSLAYWREAHWRFFSRTLPAIGKEPTLDMPLVCERFRLIYPPVLVG